MVAEQKAAVLHKAHLKEVADVVVEDPLPVVKNLPTKRAKKEKAIHQRQVIQRTNQ